MIYWVCFSCSFLWFDTKPYWMMNVTQVGRQIACVWSGYYALVNARPLTVRLHCCYCPTLTTLHSTPTDFAAGIVRCWPSHTTHPAYSTARKASRSGLIFLEIFFLICTINVIKPCFVHESANDQGKVRCLCVWPWLDHNLLAAVFGAKRV